MDSKYSYNFPTSKNSNAFQQKIFLNFFQFYHLKFKAKYTNFHKTVKRRN